MKETISPADDLNFWERTRPACWRSRPRDRELVRFKINNSKRFGEAQIAREARALPR